MVGTNSSAGVWGGMKGLFGSWGRDSWDGRGQGVGIRRGKLYRYSRAQFDIGEIEMLRKVFGEKSHPSLSSFTSHPVALEDGQQGTQKVNKGDLFELIRGLPGYEGIRTKDFEYVLEEVGFNLRSAVDFDEFVEVCLLFFLTCLSFVIYLSHRSARNFERCCLLPFPLRK